MRQVDTWYIEIGMRLSFSKLSYQSWYFGPFYNFHTNMVLVLGPRMIFFPPCCEAGKIPGIEIGI
jgi:hypothetical protein